jgi:hypothetical protein
MCISLSKIGVLLSGCLIWVMLLVARGSEGRSPIVPPVAQRRYDTRIPPDLHDATCSVQEIDPHARGMPDDTELQRRPSTAA